MGIRDWCRVYQRFGIGMAWCAPDGIYWSEFYDTTLPHNGYAICNLANDGEIMRNK
jgi:hypothetical protein